MDLSCIADPELRHWLSAANQSDVEMALQFGWRNVGYAKDTRKTTPSTVVIGQPVVAELPVQRGQVGEELVESILRERFSDITNMTKTPKSGDITLWIGGRKTIIEVKNYTSPVPTTGVDKFRRDLSTTGASAGIFISLQSPISSITTDFKIQLEPVDGRTVPCAYIVSSDRAQIITSISMCIHFASSLIGISRELYSRDSLLGSIRDLAVHVDELAGTRHNMQRELADASERAIKNSSCIMSTEIKLRGDIEKLQGELCEAVVHGGDAASVCKSIGQYDKLHADMKTHIDSVVKLIQEQPGPELVSTWKVTAKKCHNVQSGCAILFSAKRVQVSVPVSKLGIGAVSQLIMQLGSKYEWGGNVHLIDIAGETIKIIADIITGVFA
jgi:hypothetical protein